MPERHTKTSTVSQNQSQPDRCKDGVYTPPQRDVTDIAGRFNDLINGYLCYYGHFLPLAILAIVLVAVMLFAAYQFIKE